ncbi:MAG: SMC-Scp complex subunit ScpB [Candidatus Zixiibacteriota bacterium]
MDNGFHHSIVEALILASPQPLPGRKIVEVIEGLSLSKVAQAVSELNNRYMLTGSAFRIRELAGGYQFYIIPEFTPYVEELFSRSRTIRLTRAALETLAIVAYRQPVTRVEIEHIRGVASEGVIHTLLEKGLITIKGRAKTVGKPIQYGTTTEFLKFFGLNSLDDLPRMSEIEELISKPHPQAQTELKIGNSHNLTKLNIADGTFDPTRLMDDEAYSKAETSGELTEENRISGTSEADDKENTITRSTS